MTGRFPGVGSSPIRQPDKASMLNLHRFHRPLALTAFALAPVLSWAGCAVGEKSLTGSWALVSRTGAFEQMELAVEDGHRVFHSWLHERPEISAGQWALNGCTLEIRAPSEPALTYAFTVISVDGRRLTLREAGEPGMARYRRIAP